MKRIWLMFTVLCFSTAVYAGPQAEGASKTDENIELRYTVWTGNEAHLKLLGSIADAYREKNPNVSIKFDTIPYGDYVQKLTLQLNGSNPPDAGWISEASAPTFVESDALVDIAPALVPYDYEDFAKPTLKLWEKGQAVYGVPFSTSPMLIFYNKSMFEEYGVKDPAQLMTENTWTWENFARISREIKNKSGVYAFQTMDGEGFSNRNWHTIVPIIRAYGADAWTDTGECLLADPASVRAVRIIHNMVYQDRSIVPPGDLSDFFSGTAAMTMNQISKVSRLDGVDFEWGLAPLPSGPVKDAQVIGQAAMVVFKAGKNADVAADFVAFMTSKENVSALAAFFPPARESVLDSAGFATSNPAIDPVLMTDVVAYALRRGEILPAHKNAPRIELTARAGFDLLWSPNADIELILGMIKDDIEPYLE